MEVCWFAWILFFTNLIFFFFWISGFFTGDRIIWFWNRLKISYPGTSILPIGFWSLGYCSWGSPWQEYCPAATWTSTYSASGSGVYGEDKASKGIIVLLSTSLCPLLRTYKGRLMESWFSPFLSTCQPILKDLFYLPSSTLGWSTLPHLWSIIKCW